MHIDDIEKAATLARQRSKVATLLSHFEPGSGGAGATSAKVWALNFSYNGRQSDTLTQLVAETGIPPAAVGEAIIASVYDLLRCRLDGVDSGLLGLGVKLGDAT